MVIVLRNLYMREKSLLIGPKGGNIVDWPLYFLLPQEGCPYPDEVRWNLSQIGLAPVIEPWKKKLELKVLDREKRKEIQGEREERQRMEEDGGRWRWAEALWPEGAIGR